MSGADELLHQIKHASQQQTGDDVPVAFGHIASYDPKLHRVRLVIPSWRDEAGNAVLSSWMPISTGFVGEGFGMQVAPVGGATVDNPTQGEACVVSMVRKNQGVSVCAGLFFNQKNSPPFDDLKPGEFGLKAKGGSFIRMSDDMSLTLDTSHGNGKVIVNAGSGEIDLTSTTKVKVTAPAIELGNGGALQAVKLEDDTPSTVLKAQ